MDKNRLHELLRAEIPVIEAELAAAQAELAETEAAHREQMAQTEQVKKANVMISEETSKIGDEPVAHALANRLAVWREQLAAEVDHKLNRSHIEPLRARVADRLQALRQIELILGVGAKPFIVVPPPALVEADEFEGEDYTI